MDGIWRNGPAGGLQARIIHIVPRDGSLYSEDIKSIFPTNLQKRIENFDGTFINERIKKVARDNF